MQAIRPSTHILYWILLVYIFTGLLLSSASANNENYFLQTFSSDSYLVKELNEDIPADMICYQDEVNVERIPASVVFKRSSFSSNQPLSLLKKINEMQANSSRDIYFKQYLPLYFNGYSPGSLPGSVKVKEYNKKGTDSDMTPYFGLDVIQTMKTGIVTYEVALDEGSINFSVFAEKEIWSLLARYHHVVRGIYKLGDFYLINIDDPDDRYNLNSNGSYLVYPKRYLKQPQEPPDGNLFGITVKTHRISPATVESIVAIDTVSRKRVTYYPKNIARHSSDSESRSRSLEEKSAADWNKIEFSEQYLSFIPDKLLINWYDYHDDRYYSDDIPLNELPVKPEKVQQELNFGYLKKIEISLFPGSKVFIHSQNWFAAYLDFSEQVLTAEKRQKFRQTLDMGHTLKKNTELIDHLSRQFNFYRWQLRNQYGVDDRVEVTLVDQSEVSVIPYRDSLLPLPQSIMVCSLKSVYRIYFDDFKLESLLSSYLKDGRTAFVIETAFDNARKTVGVNLIIGDQTIPFNDYQLVKLAR